MSGSINLGSVEAASERFFRLYQRHCISPDSDTLFTLLEAGHSLNDRLKAGTDTNFFDVPEFAALKCIRNYFHHQQELRHSVRIIPIADYPIVTDLMTLCLVPHEAVVAAIDETALRYQEKTRQACHDVFHWYGPIVNINPALFNFVVAAYERLNSQGVQLASEAVKEFEVSYRHEEELGLPHVVDGRLSTEARSIADLLANIVSMTKF